VETGGNCGEQKRTKNGRFPQAATAKRRHRSRLPRCRNAVLLRNAGAAGGIAFVKNVKNRQKIRAACPKQLWRTCGKRKKAENFAKKFAGGLDK